MTLDMAAMHKIFELTDELGIDREHVRVPLMPQGDGSVERMPNGVLKIVIPKNVALDSWISTLKSRLLELLNEAP
jgi:hypothetical protein